MTSEEFYNEVKSSNICPSDFDEVYKEFRIYQKLAIDTLKAFHEVCEKSSIKYQLGFGSLLGAIRDHGQIPWDYDIDVIIPFSERYKLIEALNIYLPKEYYYFCPENNKECKHYFMRVSPIGFRSDRLHVDVFYVIGAPALDEDRSCFKNRMNLYFNKRRDKLARLKDFPKNAYKNMIVSVIKKIKYIFEPLSQINNNLENICSQYNPVETGITIPVLTAYKHIFWVTSELWNTELLNTELGTFRITKYYDKILKQIYKDYNKIYPLQNRLNEMYRSYYLIKYNRRIYERRSIFRYYISD